MQAFDALREIVLADPGAQARLREARDWDGFVAAATRLAAAHGIGIRREDLDAARVDARRARINRGL